MFACTHTPTPFGEFLYLTPTSLIKPSSTNSPANSCTFSSETHKYILKILHHHLHISSLLISATVERSGLGQIPHPAAFRSSNRRWNLETLCLNGRNCEKIAKVSSLVWLFKGLFGLFVEASFSLSCSTIQKSQRWKNSSVLLMSGYYSAAAWNCPHAQACTNTHMFTRNTLTTTNS